MFTVVAKINETQVSIELKSRKVALDIKEQLKKAEHEAKVIQVREVE